MEHGAAVPRACGRIRHKRLKDELLTVAELEVAAQRQGFASLEKVERAVLEPGGVITFGAKKPEPEVVRQKELLARLDNIARLLTEVRAAQGKAQESAQTASESVGGGNALLSQRTSNCA